MKYIQNTSFTVSKKPKRSFKLGETYKIYYINPNAESGIEYTFISKNGHIKEIFESTDEADVIIDKMKGEK